MEVARLQEEIARRFGLRPHERWQQELPRAVTELRRRHSLGAEQLATALFADPRLLRELAGRLTIEETFFFRFPEQLAAAVRHLGERWWRSPTEESVVWSAGCSTGEEPYSLAIGLQDSFGSLAQRCRVLACDINTDALARAREGIYGNWSFRGVAPALRERCFEALSGERFRLRDTYRKAVRFEHLAIQELAHQLRERSVRLVLFRNVGVYLDPASLERCYAAFSRVLEPDGILIQAATDPTPPPQRFVRAEGLPIGTFQAATLSPATAPRRAVRRSTLPPPPQGAPASLRPPPHVDALSLGDRGELERALLASDRVVSENPNAPAGLVLRAQIHLAADRVNAAVDDLRRALFLAPESWLTRYWYILALRGAHQLDRADGQIRELLRQLEQRPEAEVLEDGVTRVGELRAAIRALAARHE